ncbi:MAG: hypothetical protein ACREMF_03585 [Gemmatimonadales bacterium]
MRSAVTSPVRAAGYDTIPLPLALHLASYTVIGLFSMFAGGLNLIDPGHILRLGLPLLALTGFSWGYVFGILMGRKEVVALGLLASVAYAGAGAWKLGSDRPFGLLLLAIGVYGLVVLVAYRKRITA